MTSGGKNNERGATGGSSGNEHAVARRDFLKMVGLGTAALGAGSAVGLGAAAQALNVVPQEDFPEHGPESRIVSLCGLCPARCGTIVRKLGSDGLKRGEWAVKVEGNPLDPVNQGALCPVGQAMLQLVYGPDRVKSPMKCVGERGAGNWQEISWDEAIATIKAKLAELRTSGAAHTVAALSSGTSELAGRLMTRFLDVYGSPNFIFEADAAPSDGQDITQGINGRVAYDFENARYILSFGAPLFESMSPVRQMRAIGEFRGGWEGRRGKLVQIESRMSATAAKADEWVPVNPGTEGILALGIANALVKYNLYDAAFVAAHAAGFDSWPGNESGQPNGFRALLNQEYDAPKVAEITGVQVETITRLAHEFAISGPSLAVAGGRRFTGGTAAFYSVAVQALNALAGNIEKPGGVLTCPVPPLSSWPVVKSSGGAKPEAVAKPALDSVKSLARAVWESQPYKINALFLLGANPLFSSLDFPRETITKVPFVVSFASQLDETAAYADLILPDCSSLERWDIRTSSPGFALSSVAVGSPVLAPRYESRPCAQVVLDLAHSFEGDVAGAFPWTEPSQALNELLTGLYESPHGDIFTERFQTEYLRPEIRAWDWPARKYGSRDDFVKRLLAHGGWVDPRYVYGDYRAGLKAPSGKFELPRLLATEASSPIFSGGDLSGYPFELCLYQPLALIGRASANLPYLQEIVGGPQVWPWDSFIEINPKTAASLGIENGDWVIVQSPGGKLKTRALLYAGAMPNVVNLPLGQGHTALGRWAKGRGVNPLELLANGAAPRVRVSKA